MIETAALQGQVFRHPVFVRSLILFFLHREGKAARSDCLYRPSVADTAIHTFFRGTWHVHRASLIPEIGIDITPESIVGAMLRGKVTWSCVKESIRKYAETILQATKVNLDRPQLLKETKKEIPSGVVKKV